MAKRKTDDELAPELPPAEEARPEEQEPAATPAEEAVGLMRTAAMLLRAEKGPGAWAYVAYRLDDLAGQLDGTLGRE